MRRLAHYRTPNPEHPRPPLKRWKNSLKLHEYNFRLIYKRSSAALGDLQQSCSAYGYVCLSCAGGPFGGAVLYGDNFLTNRIDGNFPTLFAHSEQIVLRGRRNQFH